MNLLQRATIALCLIAVATSCFATEKERLSYTVICDDAALTERFNSGLSARLGKANIEIADQAPQAQLILYVIKDVKSNKNTSGLSIAIAHISNMKVFALALDTIKVKKERPNEILLSMLQEQGFLHHISAAHLDDASDRALDILLDSVVAAFLEKNPASSGK